MKIFKLTTWIGILMIIGTAGSADAGYIAFPQIVMQCVAGLMIAGISYLMYALTYRPKIKTRRRKIVPIEEQRKVG
ncbi:MAG: hypothetical protein IJN39_04995 [Clostridia bacterium]|nr:hypothetical protein [Clostridia bacterium]